ncbi:uncharacterized protein N0V89_011208 [Didymosphaeria variabile]|uniref:Uncharacterized protein n=1 Tax=Didymosphaeria variabile TaxID=1932322 RepID=A0A9W8XD26_9PLEO|nr:uncharacterized protein N0V89_011208 [Didymosphaeria variabile]KAJ4347268.1 hypothetical protein N0V89_011208 [Didymosphaeria variabile]
MLDNLDSYIDWLPILRARAILRVSHNDHFKVYVIKEYLADPYKAHVTNIQQVIDRWNDSWDAVLCAEPCPLERVSLKVAIDGVQFDFKPVNKWLSNVNLVDKFLRELKWKYAGHWNARVAIRYDDLEKWTQSQSIPFKEVHVVDHYSGFCSYANWLPIMRARATSNSPSRIQLHCIGAMPNDHPPSRYTSTFPTKAIDDFKENLQELLDQQSGPLMNLLRKEPCPLEKALFGVLDSCILLEFKSKPKQLGMRGESSETMFLQELGFGGCPPEHSQVNYDGTWVVRLHYN